MPSRRFPAALVAVLLPLALTACGSSRSPHVYEDRPTVDAAQASFGDLAIRNVKITSPEEGEEVLPTGESATATATIVNQGEAPDRLISVTTEAATSVELVDGDGATAERIDLPGLRAVGESDFAVRLVGLTQALRPGQHVEMTFTFTRAGRQTLLVPVATYLTPVPRPTYDVFHIPEGGEAEGEEAHG